MIKIPRCDIHYGFVPYGWFSYVLGYFSGPTFYIYNHNTLFKKFLISYFFFFLKRDFPGGPVLKILHFQCGGPGFNPWSGN